MSKLNTASNKDSALNLRVKSQLEEKHIKKIRKTLLSLVEIDIKNSKSCNIILVKKDENENGNGMVTLSINPQRNSQEDFERINQNEINIENKSNFDPSEIVDSSDFENDDDEF